MKDGSGARLIGWEARMEAGKEGETKWMAGRKRAMEGKLGRQEC